MKIAKIILSSLMMWGAALQASVTTIADRDHFSRTLQEYELVLAYFYEITPNLSNEVRSSLTEQDNVVESTSRQKRYQAANMTFMRVNVSRDDLKELRKLYGIEDFPTFILFKDGKPVMQADDKAPKKQRKVKGMSYELDLFGDVQEISLVDSLFYEINVAPKPVRPVVQPEPADQTTIKQHEAYSPRPGVLVGFATQRELENFIDSHLGSAIDEILERRYREERAAHLERPVYRRYRTYDYAPGYFGWGWGGPYSYGYYPYYGGYYGYSRPYFGFGFGFGRRHRRW